MTQNEILTHKHLTGFTVKLIHPTNKGWRVKQTETHDWNGEKKLRNPKVKTACYSIVELTELFS